MARGACFADYDNDGKVDAFVVNLGAQGNAAAQRLDEYRPLGRDQARRARRAIATALGRGLKCLPAASGGLQERVAGSGYLSQNDGPPALRIGRGDRSGQDHGALAERTRADAGEADRGSRADRRGTEVIRGLQSPCARRSCDGLGGARDHDVWRADVDRQPARAAATGRTGEPLQLCFSD